MPECAPEVFLAPVTGDVHRHENVHHIGGVADSRVDQPVEEHIGVVSEDAALPRHKKVVRGSNTDTLCWHGRYFLHADNRSPGHAGFAALRKRAQTAVLTLQAEQTALVTWGEHYPVCQLTNGLLLGHRMLNAEGSPQPPPPAFPPRLGVTEPRQAPLVCETVPGQHAKQERPSGPLGCWQVRLGDELSPALDRT